MIRKSPDVTIVFKELGEIISIDGAVRFDPMRMVNLVQMLNHIGHQMFRRHLRGFDLDILQAKVEQENWQTTIKIWYKK